MCNDQTTADAIVALAENMKTNLIRVIITIRTEAGEDREAVAREASAVASSLKRAGAVLAEPIAGQPLIVAELGRAELLRLTNDPHIICVSRDEPAAAD